MAANVEKMFYVDATGRNTPWHGLGTRVLEAPNSDDALRIAGLDWEVAQTPSYITVGGQQVPTGELVNYRVSDNAVLGSVSERYKPLQNREAFEFTNELIGNGDVRYDTAGSLSGGRIVWLLARLPQMEVLGDDYDRFLLFSNSHDGSTAVRCTVTNVRVVCQNTLNLAFNSAVRSFSFIHAGDIKEKLEEARATILNTNRYNEQFKKNAEYLAGKRFTREQVQKFVEKLFPLKKEDYTKIQLDHIEQVRSGFYTMLDADDLQNFKGTGWGLINAASDYAYHARPLRLAKTYNESLMKKAIYGNKFLDNAMQIVMAA